MLPITENKVNIPEGVAASESRPSHPLLQGDIQRIIGSCLHLQEAAAMSQACRGWRRGDQWAGWVQIRIGGMIASGTGQAVARSYHIRIWQILSLIYEGRMPFPEQISLKKLLEHITEKREDLAPHVELFVEANLVECTLQLLDAHYFTTLQDTLFISLNKAIQLDQRQVAIRMLSLLQKEYRFCAIANSFIAGRVDLGYELAASQNLLPEKAVELFLELHKYNIKAEHLTRLTRMIKQFPQKVHEEFLEKAIVNGVDDTLLRMLIGKDRRFSPSFVTEVVLALGKLTLENRKPRLEVSILNLLLSHCTDYTREMVCDIFVASLETAPKKVDFLLGFTGPWKEECAARIKECAAAGMAVRVRPLDMLMCFNAQPILSVASLQVAHRCLADIGIRTESRHKAVEGHLAETFRALLTFLDRNSLSIPAERIDYLFTTAISKDYPEAAFLILQRGGVSRKAKLNALEHLVKGGSIEFLVKLFHEVKPTLVEWEGMKNSFAIFKNGIVEDSERPQSLRNPLLRIEAFLDQHKPVN